MKQQPWLKSYGDAIPATIDPDIYPSVREMLDQAMAKFADKPALRSFGQMLTYSDVDAKTAALAAFLQKKLGVKKATASP